MGTTSILSNLDIISFNDISSEITSLSSDSIIIVALFVFFLFYTAFRGKSRSTTILLSIYFSGFILSVFPYWDFILKEDGIDPFLLTGGIFIVIFLLVRLAMKTIIFSSFPNGIFSRWSQSIFLSILITILLLFYTHQIIPLDNFYSFSPEITSILSSPMWFFWALVAPIVGIYLMNRNEF